MVGLSADERTQLATHGCVHVQHEHAGRKHVWPKSRYPPRNNMRYERCPSQTACGEMCMLCVWPASDDTYVLHVCQSDARARDYSACSSMRVLSMGEVIRCLSNHRHHSHFHNVEQVVHVHVFVLF